MTHSLGAGEVEHEAVHSGSQRRGQMTEQDRIGSRLQAVEEKLARLETLLVDLGQKLDTAAPAPAENPAAIHAWVTDYVSMRRLIRSGRSS